jgi:hypothetical protein
VSRSGAASVLSGIQVSSKGHVCICLGESSKGVAPKVDELSHECTDMEMKLRVELRDRNEKFLPNEGPYEFDQNTNEFLCDITLLGVSNILAFHSNL